MSEGGATDTYSLSLKTQPTADVRISLTSNSGQLTLDRSELIFTPENWATPQTVGVSAVDDALTEGNQTGAIQHAVSSQGPSYGSLAIPDLTVQIQDNDGSIAGRIWNDADGNRLNNSEAPLAGWTVFLDADLDGELDPGERFTLTDNTGTYRFDDLRPGVYSVDQVVQAGWVQTFPWLDVSTTASDLPLVLPSVDLGPVSEDIATLQFSRSTYVVKEDGTALTEVWITRTGDLSQSVSVTLRLTDGTATGCGCAASSVNNDFNYSPITISFAPNELMRLVSVENARLANPAAIRIRDDSKAETSEDFQLQLSNPSTGAVIGNQATATVTIVDNDSASGADLLAALATTQPAQPASAVSLNPAASALIGLDAFLADPRFASFRGQGFSSVIIDTGIDADHSIFGADLNLDGRADRLAYQYDFADDDGNATDRSGHGTHIASIISSIASDSSLIALKVFKDSGSGSFAYLERALQWVNANAAAYNIASVNLSLGDGLNWSDPSSHYGLGDEFASLASQGVLISAAAGNNFYKFASTPGFSYPGVDPNVIPVGAVWTADLGGNRRFTNGAIDFTTGPDRIPSFSQRELDGLPFLAPGILIEGARAGGGTISMGGTSQATGFVSGLATIAQQISVASIGRRLSLAEFKTLLAQSGDWLVDGDDENDNVINTGGSYPRLNALRLAEAIAALDPGSLPGPGGSQGGGADGHPSPAPTTLSLSHTINLLAGQVVADRDFGNQLQPTDTHIPTSSDDNLTLNEDAPTLLSLSDFGSYADIDGDPFAVVKITSLPASGTLQLHNGTTWISASLNQEISAADINAGRLRFVPALDAFGSPYASVGFQVGDGQLFSDASYTLTLNVLPVKDAPASSNDSLTLNEDTPTLLTLSDFGVYADVDGDPLAAVKITALTASGSLQLFNGTSWLTVSPNQEISAADINAGKLRFVPALYAFGSPYASVGFQVGDGQLFSDASYTLTLNVLPVNDAPASSNDSLTLNEDTPTLLTLSDFGVYADVDGDPLAAVKITALPASGTLQLHNGTTWIAATLNQEISAADINAGKLRFVLAPNAFGSPYSSLAFQVGDGQLFSDASYTLTLNVIPVNDAPTSSNDSLTLNEDTPTLLTLSDFGVYADVDGNPLAAVKITALPASGSLQLFNGTSWLTVSPNQEISAADINAGKLRFVPALDAFGSPYASVGFQVGDGQLFSDASYTLTLNVLPVNDAPSSTDDGLALNEDTLTLLTLSDFGVYADVESDPLAAVKTTALPASGSLQLFNGTSWLTVSPNQEISAADINAGKLRFVPALDAFGSPYASVGFQVGDGQLFSDASYTLTLNVLPVNDAPSSTDDGLALNEDTLTLLTLSDFGVYADVESDPLAAVKTTALPASGSLQLFNGTSWLTVSPNQEISAADINAGKLRFVPALDAFGSPYASVGFQVGDGQLFSDASYTLTLNVTPVNDGPAVFAISGSAAVGQSLTAKLLTADPDGNGTGGFSYQWQSSADGSSWAAVGGNSAFYSVSAADQGKQLRLQITYNDGQNFAEALTIAAGSVATSISLSAHTIAENVDTSSGVLIGNLTVTDDALGSNSLSLEGDDSASFEIRNGNQLFFIGSSPNFESKNSYSVNVISTDGSLIFSQAFTINVTDVNEPPIALSLANTVTSLAENTSTASRIKLADIAISDDALGTNTISLAGADAANFELSGTELCLKAGTALNFEAKTSYDLTVSVSDPALSDRSPIAADFRLGISDVKELPGTPTVATVVPVPVGNGEVKQITVNIINGDLVAGSQLRVISGLGINATSLTTLAQLDVTTNASGLDFQLTVDETGADGARASLNALLDLVAADLLPQLTEPGGVRRPDRKLLFYGVNGTGAISPLTYDPITGTGARFYDLDNDGTADFFTLSLIDGGYGDKDGQVNGVIDDPSVAGFADLTNLRFSNAGSGTLTVSDPSNAAPAAVNLRATLSGRPTSANQIGYVVLNASEVASADALLSDLTWLRSRSQTLFSTLESSDVTVPSGIAFDRDIQLINGQSIRFFEVVDASLDQLSSLADSRFRFLTAGEISNAQAGFSSSSSVRFGLSLLPGDPGLNALVGNAQGLAPVLDLSTFATAQSISGTLVLGREADFNATAGFYRSLDAQGTVLAADGITRIRPGDSGYAAAALRPDNRVGQLDGLDVADNQTSSRSFSGVSGGSFLALFAQVNGNTFFAYSAANTDRISHFRSLGNNLFGLEDMVGGGDLDYDDLVIGFNVSAVV